MLITATWYFGAKDIQEDISQGTLFFWFPFFKKGHEAKIAIGRASYSSFMLTLTYLGDNAQLHNVPNKFTKTLYYPYHLKRYNSFRPEIIKELEDEYRKVISYSD